jgi:putative transposase
MQQMDPALVTLAQQGSKTYADTFELLHRREAQAPNAIWQADHTLLDIVLKDDKGLAKKPWLTIIIDDYSRAIAGYMLAFEAPSALHTALALRQAIWRKSEPLWQVCGLPAVLYTDHGSDFTSKHLEQVCADLKIRAIFSQIGKPRGRGRVERFFNTLNHSESTPCGPNTKH